MLRKAQYAVSRFVKKVEAIQGRQRLLVAYQLSGITIDSQNDFTLIDRDEEGELICFEIETNSAQMAIEITTQGDAHSTWKLCDDTMQDLLRKGRGLTPGDAEITSGERSKDPTGQRCENFMFLARYKDEEFTDYLGTQDRTFVARFDPSRGFPYTGLTVRIKNYNALEIEPKTILSGTLLTYVYGDYPTKQGTELHTEDIVLPESEDTEDPIGIDPADTPVSEPPPPTEEEVAEQSLQETEDEVAVAAVGQVIEGDLNYNGSKPSFMARTYDVEYADA